MKKWTLKTKKHVHSHKQPQARWGIDTPLFTLTGAIRPSRRATSNSSHSWPSCSILELLMDVPRPSSRDRDDPKSRLARPNHTANLSGPFSTVSKPFLRPYVHFTDFFKLCNICSLLHCRILQSFANCTWNVWVCKVLLLLHIFC